MAVCTSNAIYLGTTVIQRVAIRLTARKLREPLNGFQCFAEVRDNLDHEQNQ